MFFERFFSPTGTGGGVSNETPSQPGGIGDSPMPTSGQKDANTSWESERASLEARYQRDINGLKSTLQKQMAEQQRQWDAQRAAYEKRIQEIEVQGMDDKARKEYEQRKAAEDAQSWQQRYQDAVAQLEERQAMEQWIQYFLAQGIPATALNMGAGLDGLISSGWEAVSSELAELRKRTSTTPGTSQPAQRLSQDANPPQVLTNQPGTPATGTSWDALIAKYGSAETVYSMVEQGKLPPSIIPQ